MSNYTSDLGAIFSRLNNYPKDVQALESLQATFTRLVVDQVGNGIDTSLFLLKDNNLSEIPSPSTARASLGLGTLATQSGTLSGTNTGDETTGRINTLYGYTPADATIVTANTAAILLKSDKYPTVNAQTDNYTFVLTDVDKIVTGNKATALSFTIPPNSSVAYPLNSIIHPIRIGVGALTIVAGAGVTVTGTAGVLTDAGLGVEMSLRQTATDVWLLQNGTTPVYTAWTPSYTGFSANPTFTARYLVVGKLCHVYMTASAHGTSNLATASGTTFTLPFTSANTATQNVNCAKITDNGTSQAANGLITIPANSNIATVYRDGTVILAWTASGNKSWNCSFSYEIA